MPNLTIARQEKTNSLELALWVIGFLLPVTCSLPAIRHPHCLSCLSSSRESMSSVSHALAIWHALVSGMWHSPHVRRSFKCIIAWFGSGFFIPALNHEKDMFPGLSTQYKQALINCVTGTVLMLHVPTCVNSFHCHRKPIYRPCYYHPCFIYVEN